MSGSAFWIGVVLMGLGYVLSCAEAGELPKALAAIMFIVGIIVLLIGIFVTK